eukprot:3608198-Amphidinium_carterae.1
MDQAKFARHTTGATTSSWKRSESPGLLEACFVNDSDVPQSFQLCAGGVVQNVAGGAYSFRN